MVDLQGSKDIIIGAVSMLLIFLVIKLYEIGLFSKNQKFIYTTKKKIGKLIFDLDKLDKLCRDGILNEDELESKSDNIRNEINTLRIDLLLSEDKTYKKLKESFDDDLITADEYITKEKEIRNNIKSNL